MNYTEFDLLSVKRCCLPLLLLASFGVVVAVVIDLSVQVKRDEHTVCCEIAVYFASFLL